MQVALKCATGYKDMDVKACADDVVRLELAGVASSKVQHTISPVEAGGESSASLVEAIADKVMEKLRVSDDSDVSEVRSRDNWQYSRSGRGNNRGNNRGRGRATGRNNGAKPCRSCGSTEHLIKNCPTKFCEACGQRGCNQWSRECPKHQQ